MHIAENWRYPVKSMAGERLRMAALTTAGIPGDRLVQVRGLQDRVLSARRYPWLLGLQGGVDERGEATIDGRTWCSAEALDQVRRIAGQDAHLERDEDPEVRFDVLPLLVATDGAIAAFGHDRRNAMTELTCATGVEHLMDYLDGSVSPELTEALERHAPAARNAPPSSPRTRQRRAFCATRPTSRSRNEPARRSACFSGRAAAIAADRSHACARRSPRRSDPRLLASLTTPARRRGSWSA